MNFPEKIGHNYRFIKCYDIELLGSRFSKHKRLRVFYTHGLQCANPLCNKEGTYLIKAKNHSGGFHVDVYTKDFELMTIDHIQPRSKGGKNNIENLQPMCQTCNTKKGDKV